MKTKLLTAFCVIAIGACSVNMCRADETADAVGDAVVLRPLGFCATVIGGVLFVVTLPFTAGAKDGIAKSAHVLVEKPAKATFQRPLGDFRGLEN
jgi:hypothetical protein